MTTGRRYFDEGEQAFEDEKEMDDCPHALDSREGIEWCAGWEYAEHHNDMEVRGQEEDYRLDDPRHRQAEWLNY